MQHFLFAISGDFYRKIKSFSNGEICFRDYKYIIRQSFKYRKLLTRIRRACYISYIKSLQFLNEICHKNTVNLTENVIEKHIDY